MRRLVISAITILTLLLALSSPARAELYVVVSNNNQIDALTQKEIVNIFMGKVSFFPNGSMAKPVDQAESSDARETFYQEMTNKTLAQIGAYWAKLLFTGRHFPPDVIDSEEAILDALKADPSAIAYISDPVLAEQLNVVFTIP